MTGINLSQVASERERSSVARRQMVGPGFYAAVALALVTVGVWGGVAWYRGQVVAEAAALVVLEKEKQKELSQGDSVATVADVVGRMETTSKVIGARVSLLMLLDGLQAVTLPNAAYSALGYEQPERKVSLEVETENFRGFVEQAMLLKQLDGFGSLSIGGAQRDTEINLVKSSMDVTLAAPKTSAPTAGSTSE